MIFNFETLAAVQIGFVLLGVRWYLRQNDEVPLLTSVCIAYFSSFRYWSVVYADAAWVNISNFGFDSIDSEAALAALELIVLCEAVMLCTYMRVQGECIKIEQFDLPAAFECWLRPKVFGFALVAIPLVTVAHEFVGQQVESGKSMAFEISNYVILAPMMLVGIGSLLLLLWKFGAFKRMHHNWIPWALIIMLFRLTFDPSSRFLFLGWLLAGAVIVTSGYSPKLRLSVAVVLLVGAMALFAIAGALRNSDESRADLYTAAWARAVSGNDANMLDGFVLLQQVYPERLPYSYGMEHLEIFLRPIPRAFWPEKPVGGYMNKLGIITAATGFTLGISPSLFGSFYQEGGILGGIFLSFIYGWAIARLAGC